MIFDKWQQEVLDHQGNIALRAGRQVGKSTVVGKKAGDFALENKGANILMIGAAQRQSFLLFEKARIETDREHERAIKQAVVDCAKAIKEAKTETERKIALNNALGSKNNINLTPKKNLEQKRAFESKNGIYKEIPTKTEITLKNGSRIYSLPAGKTGHTIRGLSLDLLIADEAAYIPEAVWLAVRPMIAVSKKERGLGFVILLSTPFGKGGYFYDCCNDEDFKQFHISSEDCDRIPKSFLKKEKARLTRMEYAQEYLGEFVDEFQQFFPTALIKERMTFMEWHFDKDYKPGLKYFLGVDLARYGQDENAFVVGEMDKTGFMRAVSVETTNRISLDRTFNHIVMKDEKYKFNRILIDDAGLGAGITDMLIAKLGRRVLGLNNAKKSLDAEAKQTGKIFKEDLYSNASMMMERGAIDLINSIKLARSLKSMTFEYTSDKNIIIKGKYSHISEAFVRVCWAPKAKGLKLFVY